MNILPDRYTQAYTILNLIAISGELPASQIARLPGGEAYKRKIIKALKRDNLLYTYYGDRLRGLRLTARAKVLLLEDNPARFGFFLTGDTETNAPRYALPRRLRLHRISEAYITMYNAGVSIFRDDKPDIFCPDSSGIHDIRAPTFYGSREMKALGADFTAIHNARAVGVLLTADTVFAVYNTGDTLMKWDYKPEMRLKALMKHTLCQQRLPLGYSVRALMLGNDMDAAFRLMTNTNGKRNYFVLDDNYDSFPFIPNDRHGETLLRLLCDPALMETLDQILSENLEPPDLGGLIEHDAADGDGDPVLFGYGFDMPRIARFSAALQLRGRRGTLICFDFQADALRRYCCDNVRLQSIDFTKFERRFFP